MINYKVEDYYRECLRHAVDLYKDTIALGSFGSDPEAAANWINTVTKSLYEALYTPKKYTEDEVLKAYDVDGRILVPFKELVPMLNKRRQQSYK